VTARHGAWLQRRGLVAVALAAAGLLKLHYSRATAEQLCWILGPTTGLSSLVLGREFVFRSGEGYLSRELSILISPACAGVNFLIVAFLSLALGFGRHFPTVRSRARWLVVAAAAAYVTTLVVNVLRIALSVALAHLAARASGLTFQSVHRLLGIAVYLAGLLTLCLTVQVWLGSRCGGASKRGALLVALACYAGVTLLIPLLRGAYQSPEYFQHAVPVSVLVGGLAALLFAAKGRTWDDGRHEFRSSEHPKPTAHQSVTGG
jgi:exosortase K